MKINDKNSLQKWILRDFPRQIFLSIRARKWKVLKSIAKSEFWTTVQRHKKVHPNIYFYRHDSRNALRIDKYDKICWVIRSACRRLRSSGFSRRPWKPRRASNATHAQWRWAWPTRPTATQLGKSLHWQRWTLLYRSQLGYESLVGSEAVEGEEKEAWRLLRWWVAFWVGTDRWSALRHIFHRPRQPTDAVWKPGPYRKGC